MTTDPNAWIKKQLKPRGRKRAAPRKGKRADYGRRVRNILSSYGMIEVIPVIPHTGPKPRRLA